MLIFLHGPDTFRSRRKLNELRQKFNQTSAQASLNVTVLTDETIDAVEFENAINAAPFLAAKRLVIVERLLERHGNKKMVEAIYERLNRAKLDTTSLIFWEGELAASRANAKKTPGEALLTKLKQADHVQEFKLLDPASVAQWASAEVTSRQGTIDPAALTLLVGLTGNDLWQLNAEIDKLLAYCHGRTIAASDVETLVQTKLDEDIFKLTDAVGRRQKAAALHLISDQLASGTTAAQLLAKITWQFRNLLLVKLLLTERGPAGLNGKAAYQLGLHPFVVKKAASQAGNYQLADLKKIYARLANIEHKIKTSQVAPAVLLNLLVVSS